MTKMLKFQNDSKISRVIMDISAELINHKYNSLIYFEVIWKKKKSYQKNLKQYFKENNFKFAIEDGFDWQIFL